MATTTETPKVADSGAGLERGPSRVSRISSVEQQDEHELAEFGYKQELKREWGLLHNFGISFSIIVRASHSPLRSMWHADKMANST